MSKINIKIEFKHRRQFFFKNQTRNRHFRSRFFEQSIFHFRNQIQHLRRFVIVNVFLQYFCKFIIHAKKLSIFLRRDKNESKI